MVNENQQPIEEHSQELLPITPQFSNTKEYFVKIKRIYVFTLAIALLLVLIGSIIGWYNSSPSPYYTNVAILTPKPTQQKSVAQIPTSSSTPLPSSTIALEPTTIAVLKPTVSPTTTPQTFTDTVIEVMVDDGTLYVIQEDGYHRAEVRSILQKFYEIHPDAYDFISIWDDSSPSQAFTHMRIKSDVSYTKGDQTYNDSDFFHAPPRLLGANKFNNLDDVDLSWDGIYNGLVHETGHQWLAYFWGTELQPLINEASTSHWSPYLSMNGTDPMGGNAIWVDNGNDTCTWVKSNATEEFSLLSLYMMGLANSSEVPSYLLVNSLDASLTDSSISIPCTVSYYNAYDVISVIGDRSPTYQTSQKDFTMAFIFILRNAQSPTQEQIDKLTTIAKTFPQHWYRATGGRSTMNTIGLNPLYP